MQNVLLAYNNMAVGATFAGTAASGYPATNLADDNISKPWRSDALPGTKTFTGTFSATATVTAIALMAHNLTSSATFRLRLRATSGGPDLYDSGSVNALRMTYNGVLPSDWGAVYDVPHYFTAVPGVGYAIVDITDASNPAGYVQVGRFFMGATSFQPAANAEVGLGSAWIDTSVIVLTPTRKKLYTELPKVRQEVFGFPQLTEAEGDQLHDMMGFSGTTREVLYLPDPSDMAKCQRYGFVGQLEKLDPLIYSEYLNRKGSFQITKKQ